ncbi:unnamed protein product [Effrenium voratum]|uniref:Homogentisate prenyltransferase n=1 Tax=Effrenium voratum TaxID=2562239 RepID=A0AA36J4W6_9DINO|nr:unnamed protein product [Effrenium voratum]CAJ1398610.1 unnamed protein product [Effrenium voratum]CAJ1451330.1 unnamed protein product [Effrenium voratum]
MKRALALLLCLGLARTFSGRPLCPRTHFAGLRKLKVRAQPGADASAESEKANVVEAFWKFLRPHTIRGTILGSSAMVTRVVIENGQAPDWSLLPKAALGVLALLCGNGYIVGINQIYDVSIDVINKPFLPVAAKELSVTQAWVLISVMAVLGVGLSYSLFGPLIGSLYAFGLFLGTIYSVPPLRLKKSAIAAALIIATVRGFLLNFGVYYATRAMLGVPFGWSFPTIFITCFCSVYALVIAVTKDLPDVQGDLENKIDTFATRFGVGTVATAASMVLLANYGAALAWTRSVPAAFRPQVLLPAHGILAAMLARGLLRLRRTKFSQEGVKAFYRLIWLLFYSEYFLFPFV